MARLPLLDPETAKGDAAKLLSNLKGQLNIYRMMAHAETLFQPIVLLGKGILSAEKLPAKDRELLVLQVTQHQGGEYEWIQHEPIAIGVGVRRDQVDALATGDIASSAFSTSEAALLAFSKQVIENVRVDDSTFAAVKEHLSDQEIVEAIITIGFYMMMTRLTEVTETDLDQALGVEAFNAELAEDPTRV